ncbi:hypothetical protein QRE66_17910 [Bacillus cereus]|nr:hypothetical protein QRE66_17910 [Bacillus cereus]
MGKIINIVNVATNNQDFADYVLENIERQYTRYGEEIEIDIKYHMCTNNENFCQSALIVVSENKRAASKS